MKPDLSRFLEVACAHLMLKVAPALPVSYGQADANLLGVMLTVVGEEAERAAARRVDENAALRELFGEAAPVVTDAGLRGRLQEASRGADESLRVSDLELRNASLRGLLVELHAHVEALDTPEARRIDDAIWSELVASTERRKLAIGPF